MRSHEDICARLHDAPHEGGGGDPKTWYKCQWCSNDRECTLVAQLHQGGHATLQHGSVCRLLPERMQMIKPKVLLSSSGPGQVPRTTKQEPALSRQISAHCNDMFISELQQKSDIEI